MKEKDMPSVVAWKMLMECSTDWSQRSGPSHVDCHDSRVLPQGHGPCC